MERLTSNNYHEMGMYQLALNQVYVGSDGWAWYVNSPEDHLSVCDLIRNSAEALGVELPIFGDEDLADLLTDWLQYGAREPEGVLAILYRALCAMAELHARLAAYEDTGLGPDEITLDKPSCAFYCNRRCNLDGDWCAEGPGCPYEITSKKALALLEPVRPNAPRWGVMVSPPCFKADGDGCAYQCADGDDEPIAQCKQCPLCCADKHRHHRPNPPLTLEELEEMGRRGVEPVYLSPGDCYVFVSHNGFAPIFSWSDGTSCSARDWYAQVGPAYRRKPEEGTT